MRIDKEHCIITIALILVTLNILSVQAQDKPRVSVMAFNASQVSKEATATLTILFETELVNIGTFDVIEQTNAEAILKAQEYTLQDCTDEACAIEIGKLLSADHIVLGTVSLLDNKYIINVKLIDIQEGRNIRAKSIQAGDLGALADELSVLAYLLTGSEEIYGGRGQVELVEEESNNREITEESSGQQRTKKAYVTFLSATSELTFKLYNAAGELLRDGRTPTNFLLSQAVYRVEAEAPLYYPFKDKLTVSSPHKMEYTIWMKPNFGSIEIESNPSGADVLLNGLKVGTTPFYSERMKSGEYIFLIEKELYASKTAKVKVEDGKDSSLKEELIPEFVHLFINEKSHLEGDLYIDGIYEGELPFKGRIPYRTFKIEVRPNDSRYRAYSTTVTVKEPGEEITYEISLAGIYGSVAVDVDPFLEADIYIDGKKRGVSPDQFDLLIGSHEIKVTGKLDGKKFIGTRRIKLQESDDLELSIKMAEDVVLIELNNKLKSLKLDLEKVTDIRKTLTGFGWISCGVGLISGGLIPLFGYLSTEAFDKYTAATYTEDAVSYRRQVQMYDGLKVSAAIVGGLSITLSVFFWTIIGPKTKKLQNSILLLEAELEDLKQGDY